MGTYSKRIIGLLTLIVVAAMPIIAQAQSAGVHLRSVELEPAASNYIVRTLISIQPRDNLTADQDFITIMYDEAFFVPSDINPQFITIGDFHPLSVQVVGNSVSLRLPEDLRVGGRGRRDITIHKSAGIYNPVLPGNYTISVATNTSSGVESETVTISGSGSSVHSVMLNPLPAIENEIVDMFINFMTGDGGLLETGQYIDVTFPQAFDIPLNYIAGVTVNEMIATAQGIEGNKLRVYMPFTARYSTCVAIRVNKNSGLINSEAGTYTISVKTETEPEDISSVPFTINAIGEMSAPAVELTPDIANSLAEITIHFFTGYHGIMQSGKDYYEITAPQSMSLPSTISKNNVRTNYEGYSELPHTISVENDSTIRVTPARNIESGKIMSITFLPQASIQLPNLWGGYTLGLKPFKQDGTALTGQKKSNNFYVGKARFVITNPRVWFDKDDRGGSYTKEMTIDFKLGRYGRLLGGTGEVILELPKRADLRNHGQISINGIALQSEEIEIDQIENVVKLRLPESLDIQNYGSVSVVINNVDNLIDNELYQLYARTSVEIRPVLSEEFYGSYAKENQINVTAFATTENRVNRAFGIDVTFQDFEVRRNNHLVFFRFPINSLLPTYIAKENIILFKNGVASEPDYIESVTTEPETNTLIVELSAGLDAHHTDEIRLEINSNAGIRHTTNPGEHGIEISSTEHKMVRELPIMLSGNELNVTEVSAKAIPNYAGAQNVVCEISFKPGIFGRLTVDNEIFIQFPDEVILPSHISINSIFVNSSNIISVELINSNTIKITLSDGFKSKSGETILVRIDETAGIENASAWSSIDGELLTDISVKTDAENLWSVDTENLLLRDEALLQVYKFYSTSNIVNAASGYGIEVQLDLDTELKSGQKIYITFPETFEIPQAIDQHNIRINGAQLSTLATSDSNTIIIPVNQDISGGELLMISINNSAGILNATCDGAHHISFSLDNVNWIDSPSIYLEKSGSQVSQAIVKPDSARPSVQTRYKITFQTGEHGRLYHEDSKLEIQFPDGTSLNNVNSVLLQNVEAIHTVTGQSIIIDIPKEAQIGNFTDVSINIDDVINPSAESTNYKLKIRTCVEETWSQSKPYSIAFAGPVTIQNKTLFALANSTVNEPMKFQLQFEVDLTLDALSGIIILSLPEDVQIPTGFEAMTFNDPLLKMTIEGQLFEIYTMSDFKPLKNEMSFVVPAQISASSGAVTLAFEGHPDLLNPREPSSDYVITLTTNKQPIPSVIEDVQVLASYGTAISDVAVNIMQFPNKQFVESVLTFRTGTLGALKAGQAKIRIQIPSYFVLPNHIDNSSILVNNIRPDRIDIQENTLYITIPNAVRINRSEYVHVFISRAAMIYLDTNRNIVSSDEMQLLDTSDDGFSTSTTAEPEFVSAGDVNTLPVELTDFSLNGTGNSVELIWKTATETDNYGFSVERAFESKNAGVEDKIWQEISFIDGKGTSRIETTYHFNDKINQGAGIYYYRLRQIDYDGKYKIYETQSYTYTGPEKFSLKSNYPNPFNPVTTIPYSIATESNVSLVVYDAIGRRVQVLVDQNMQPRVYNAQFDAGSLASGMYFVRFSANGNIFTQKMMLIK